MKRGRNAKKENKMLQYYYSLTLKSLRVPSRAAYLRL